jgi:hypothetical protein
MAWLAPRAAAGIRRQVLVGSLSSGQVVAEGLHRRPTKEGVPMARSTRAVLGLLLAGSTALGLMAVAGSASAATSRHASATKLKGTITCTLTGTIKANPPLTLATAKTTTLTFSGTLSRCKRSKKTSIKITGAKFKGTSKASTDCSDLLASLPALKGKVTYKTRGGSAAPTKVSYSGGTLSATNGVVATYPGTGDTGKSTGSFAGSTTTLTGHVKQSATQLQTSCSSSAGLKTLSFTSKSSFKA